MTTAFDKMYIGKDEKELKAKTHVDFEGEIGSADKIFPHEFLFLLCNTKSRLEQIKRLPLPEFTIERRNIRKYDM